PTVEHQAQPLELGVKLHRIHERLAPGPGRRRRDDRPPERARNGARYLVVGNANADRLALALDNLGDLARRLQDEAIRPRQEVLEDAVVRILDDRVTRDVG